MQEFLTTIAEGSRQLGVSERTLRRVLREPDMQAQLRSTNRQVRGREREVKMIPPQLLTNLRTRFSSEHPHKPTRQPTEAFIGQQTGITFTGASLVTVYQRLVTEKYVVVEQLQERISDLQRAVEYERCRSKRTQQQALSSRAVDNINQRAIVTASLADELRRLFADAPVSAVGDESKPAGASETGTPVVSAAGPTGADLSDLPVDPSSLVRIYEWVLKEKDQLIEQQHQRITDLQSSLEHERDQSERTQLLFEIGEPSTRKLLGNSTETAPETPKRSWLSWFKL
jgi:hypothetical protein